MIISEWFERKIRLFDFTSMYQAMLTGDAEGFEQAILKQLTDSISYYDSEERFYHGFLLGLLKPLQGYDVVSNRERGDGRPDILLEPDYEKNPAVIIEIKHVKQYAQMEEGCNKALAQIEEKNYEEGLLEEGFQKIIKYGICFCKKSCRVQM